VPPRVYNVASNEVAIPMTPPRPARLTAFVKAEARRLGFDLVGVTTPDPPPHLDVYERWIAEGRHGDMAYLATDRARQRRADPRQILTECRSILILGVNCLPRLQPRLRDAPAARIAAYAQGDDYHSVLPTRLRPLISALERRVGLPFPHRIYTDTGPLLERELAQRAGLGWIGKNTCLINPRRGSFFLLAEVLLGLDLVPDQPFPHDRCGTCTRCLEACPTGCILADRTLDARRCISYLTIEAKGDIPASLRPAIGGWVFGCDRCQQVCPWNERFASPTSDPAFQPRPALDPADLLGLLRMSPESLRRDFRESPLLRPKRRGLSRNIIVASGNLGLSGAASALAGILLHETEPLLRAHAAWALGRIADPEAVLALRSALNAEEETGVRAEIEAALGRIQPLGEG
jgi:epoxyqueuosine reductase